MKNVDLFSLRKPVVLFDGVCNLCNSSVDFLVRNEKGNQLRFASLQSEIGQEIIATSKLDTIPDSILLYHKGELKYKSQAILSICKYLKFPWSFGIIFKIAPSFISDLVYDWVARNRYSWFGKKESCRIPTQEEIDKFLG